MTRQLPLHIDGLVSLDNDVIGPIDVVFDEQRVEANLHAFPRYGPMPSRTQRQALCRHISRICTRHQLEAHVLVGGHCIATLAPRASLSLPQKLLNLILGSEAIQWHPKALWSARSAV